MTPEQREKAIDLYIQDVRNDIIRWAIDGNHCEIDYFIRIHLDPGSLDDDTLLSVIDHHLDNNGEVPID